VPRLTNQKPDKNGGDGAVYANSPKQHSLERKQKKNLDRNGELHRVAL